MMRGRWQNRLRIRTYRVGWSRLVRRRRTRPESTARIDGPQRKPQPAFAFSTLSEFEQKLAPGMSNDDHLARLNDVRARRRDQRPPGGDCQRKAVQGKRHIQADRAKIGGI